MYEDPNVTERRVIFMVEYASDDANDPIMRGEIVERLSELTTTLGVDLIVLTDLTSIVRAAVEYAERRSSEAVVQALVERIQIIEGLPL